MAGSGFKWTKCLQIAPSWSIAPAFLHAPHSGRLGNDWATSNRGSEADRVETTEHVQERLAGESRDVLFLAFRVLVLWIWRDGKL